jgi:hypothetical protein
MRTIRRVGLEVSQHTIRLNKIVAGDQMAVTLSNAYAYVLYIIATKVTAVLVAFTNGMGFMT